MISVCMATYNGEKYVSEQLDSILSQISDADEVIIQDDNSKDGTVSVILNYADSRIKIEVNEVNMGVVRTFEAAIKRSTGDHIFLSDQDDIWLPTKVSECMNEFDKSPKITVVVSDAYVIDADRNLLYRSYYEMLNSGSGTIKNFRKNTFIGCCMALKREVAIQALPIPIRSRSHDAWLGLIGGLMGEVRFIASPLIYYRRHYSNASQMKKSNYLDIASRRFALFGGLVSWLYKYKLLNMRKRCFNV